MVDSISIEKTKLFKEQFWIFEKDLLAIFESISPTEENFYVYWDKIHNLLLLIWSECQNLSKEVAMSISAKELDNFDNIPSWLCYREYLEWKLSLKCKSIRFIKWMEAEKQIYIKPFEDTEQEDGSIIRERWNHYNKLKHDKMNRYNKCCLKDVIYALWTYYILLQYLILWYDKTIRCDNNGEILNSKKDIWFDSTIFSPTFCYHEKSMTLDVHWYTWIIKEEDIPLFEAILSESDDMIILHHNIAREECLYQVYLKVNSFITPRSFREFNEKRLPEVPKTHLLQFVFSFTNKKFSGGN